MAGKSSTRRVEPAHIELELKFELDEAVRERLQAAGFVPESVADVAALRSVYWDTPDGDLAAARIGLRVRRTPAGWVQTVKAEGDSPFSRYEHEAPVSSERPERAALPSAMDSRPGAIAHRHFDRLEPLFATEFERTAWRLQPAASLEVELAADVGRIDAGQHSAAISELEAERLAGSTVAFHRWALHFAARHDLRLLHPSKNERGLRLAGRLPGAAQAVKARPVAPAGGLETGAAAAQVVADCIAHFTANVEPLRTTDDPSAAHQARVALRRLRAAMRFFDLPAIDPGWKSVDALARRLADTIGRLRDADVFAAGPLQGLKAALAREPAVAALDRAVATMRDRERAAARAAVTGRDATRLVLAALYLSARLARTTRAAPRGQDLRAVPFEQFGADRIAQLHDRLERRARRAAKAARDAAAPADEAWHRVRIAAKNLRYALEFAAGALPKPKRTQQALRHLADLQQRLGAAQDGAVAPAVAMRALGGQGGAAARARAVALVEGWIAHARQDAGDSDRDKALRAVARIGKALRLPRRQAEEPADAGPAGGDQSAGNPTSTSSPTRRTG